MIIVGMFRENQETHLMLRHPPPGVLAPEISEESHARLVHMAQDHDAVFDEYQDGNRSVWLFDPRVTEIDFMSALTYEDRRHAIEELAGYGIDLGKSLMAAKKRKRIAEMFHVAVNFIAAGVVAVTVSSYALAVGTTPFSASLYFLASLIGMYSLWHLTAGWLLWKIINGILKFLNKRAGIHHGV